MTITKDEIKRLFPNGVLRSATQSRKGYCRYYDSLCCYNYNRNRCKDEGKRNCPHWKHNKD